MVKLVIFHMAKNDDFHFLLIKNNHTQRSLIEALKPILHKKRKKNNYHRML